MLLFTKEQKAKLFKNFLKSEQPESSDDHKPVVKLFTPWGSATWLITELDPENEDFAYGLCDLGMGCPEIGSVSLRELKSISGPFGLKVERDLHFTPKDTLSGYAEKASQLGYIRA